MCLPEIYAALPPPVTSRPATTTVDMLSLGPHASGTEVAHHAHHRGCSRKALCCNGPARHGNPPYFRNAGPCSGHGSGAAAAKHARVSACASVVHRHSSPILRVTCICGHTHVRVALRHSAAAHANQKEKPEPGHRTRIAQKRQKPPAACCQRTHLGTHGTHTRTRAHVHSPHAMTAASEQA